MIAVALATCAQVPALDEDDRVLVPALAALGIRAAPAVWDDPRVDWDAFDLVVVRSTWDYPARRERFLAWARAVPAIANRPEVLDWSTDKAYLADLAAAGLPVVPTRFVAPGRPPEPELLALGEGEVVVKPRVGVGSIGAARFGADERGSASRHARALHADGQGAMLQPYLPGVEHGRGETAMVYLGGAFSHAVHKGPMLLGDREAFGDGLFLVEQIAARDPEPAEHAAAGAVMEYLVARFGALPYARIDLVPGPDGDPVALECELAECSLFLRTARGAPERCAAEIGRVAQLARH